MSESLLCYTCVFAGLLIVKVYSLDWILSEHAYLCVRWMHIVQVSVITPVLSHKIPEHSRKKEKKKVTTATTTWLPIVRVSVIPLHSLDCLLSTYLLCMSVRWTAYCTSIRYTCSLHSTGILVVRVCDIPVHSLDCIIFLLSICYTCVFAGLLTAQMFAIPVLRLDRLSVVRVYVLPVYSLDCLSVVPA